jgi:hypothetical protein
VTESKEKLGLSKGYRAKETLGCLVKPILVVGLIYALIQIKCAPTQEKEIEIPTDRSPPASFPTPEENTGVETVTLSEEQIQRILSQINSKIYPHGYAVVGYNLPEPNTQVSGTLQTLPIELDAYRQILIDAQKLYVDPVAGEVESPVTPVMIVGVMGPENQLKLWWLIEVETILIGDGQRLTPEEIKIISGRVRAFNSLSMGLDDFLFIKK